MNRNQPVRDRIYTKTLAGPPIIGGRAWMIVNPIRLHVRDQVREELYIKTRG